MNDPTEVIQPTEIKKALETSGYLLEGRVACVLENRGFYVERNVFDPDPREDSRSIEIDVQGAYCEELDTTTGSTVVALLGIECKNNFQPAAFFLKPQVVPQISETYIKYRGFPTSSADPSVPLHRLLGMENWHHYCAAEVATQFCSFSRPEEKYGTPRDQWRWKVEPMQNYSKSFADLCIATEWGEAGASLDQPNIQLEFRYPVVVFQGPIFEVRTAGAELDIRPTDHLQLQHSTSVRGRAVRCQIDVVSEKGLPPLIETILGELRATAAGIGEHLHQLVMSAIVQKEAVRRLKQLPG